MDEYPASTYPMPTAPGTLDVSMAFCTLLFFRHSASVKPLGITPVAMVEPDVHRTSPLPKNRL